VGVLDVLRAELIRKGVLPAIRPGGRLVRISLSAVIAHEAKCETIAPDCAAPPAPPRTAAPAAAALAGLRAERMMRGMIMR
jgi:hypothetical protein